MKTENSTLKKKLAYYSAFAGSFIAGIGIAEGQVVYHDVNPDRVLTSSNPSDTMHVDLNNDGIPDFVFFALSNGANKDIGAAGFGYSTSANAVGGTVIVYGTTGGGSGPLLHPSALAPGAVIDQNLAWYSVNQLLFQTGGGANVFFYPAMNSLFNGSYYGQWLDGADHYVPLKLVSGTNANYGWARCNVAADATTLTIESWAVQMTANTSIQAGEGEGTGISGVNSLPGVSITAFEKNIYVSLPENISDATVSITNMLGQDLKHFEMQQRQIHFNVSDLANGLYVVTVKKDGGMSSRKVSLR